ncbi:MAG: hypothetical protein MUF54_17580, partial [Polyangiaceae bacterium]|nr:hypothetical protein [Polyangiaceae bacterium]
MSSSIALRSSIATLAGMCTLLVVHQAQADLTQSERCQIKGFVQAAEISTVSRLRALVARPDVSHEHRAQALASALRVCPFDSRTQRYLDALLLGPSSQESRSALARAVVPGLLARADIIYMQHPGEPTRDDGAAADELLRIHRFALSLVQQVEQTEGRGTAGLSRDARRAMVDAYQQHIARHRRWLGFQGRV